MLSLRSVALASALLLLCSCSPTLTGTNWQGVVVRVVDGDTLIVRHKSGTDYRVRLARIDCPERNEPQGHEATAFTRILTLNTTVTVHDHGREYYGRRLADVTTRNGLDVAEALLENKLAKPYRKP